MRAVETEAGEIIADFTECAEIFSYGEPIETLQQDVELAMAGTACSSPDQREKGKWRIPFSDSQTPRLLDSFAACSDVVLSSSPWAADAGWDDARDSAQR